MSACQCRKLNEPVYRRLDDPFYRRLNDPVYRRLNDPVYRRLNDPQSVFYCTGGVLPEQTNICVSFSAARRAGTSGCKSPLQSDVAEQARVGAVAEPCLYSERCNSEGGSSGALRGLFAVMSFTVQAGFCQSDVADRDFYDCGNAPF